MDARTLDTPKFASRRVTKASRRGAIAGAVTCRGDHGERHVHGNL